MKKVKIKESDLQSAALAWLKLHKVTHKRFPVGPVLHRTWVKGRLREFWKPSPLKGIPDICGILKRKHRGVAFGIELKSSTGRIRPEQGECLLEMSQAGGFVAVVTSMDELIAKMDEWGEVPRRVPQIEADS